MLKRSIISAFVLLLLACPLYAEDNNDKIYQVSTIDALMEGLYEGNITFGKLKEHGDFGLGTFNNVDGEMLGLDGQFFQIKTDGKAYLVPDDLKTPFAVVKFFNTDSEFQIKKTCKLSEIKEILDNNLPTKNIFYAFRIDGKFEYLKTRSVPTQQKPYPPLLEVVKEQTIFELYDVKGTIVGFWFPEYAKDINVSDYHFHFITDDRKAGGHVLDCISTDIKVKVDYVHDLTIKLLDSKDFYNLNLSDKEENQLQGVEH
jgi:acetolactate decarboxylase